MEARRERTTAKESAASPEAEATEHPGRPDWLLGPDEAIIPQAEITDLEEPASPHPYVPPGLTSAASPTAARAPVKEPEHEGPATMPQAGPDAPWSMPVRDFVSGPDMDDFRREDEAPSLRDEDQAAAPTAGWPSETAPVWHRESSNSDETAAEFAPTPDSRAWRHTPAPVPRPAESRTPSVWRAATERIRTDRRIQIAAAALALAAIFVPMVRDQLSVVPVGRIRRDPVGFDGQKVKIRGTVGEVFAVGSSSTYYLHDGRDTIVVFTRLQPPRSRQRVTVIGSVSTGYLEGVPRAALFQNAP